MKLEAQVEEEKLKTTELSGKISELETELDEKSQEIIITGKKSNNLVREEMEGVFTCLKSDQRLETSAASGSETRREATGIVIV